MYFAIPLKLTRARDLSGSKYNQSPPNTILASISGLNPGRLFMVPLGVCFCLVVSRWSFRGLV